MTEEEFMQDYAPRFHALDKLAQAGVNIRFANSTQANRIADHTGDDIRDTLARAIEAEERGDPLPGAPAPRPVTGFDDTAEPEYFEAPAQPPASAEDPTAAPCLTYPNDRRSV